ncbi:hypothetical protein BST61_g8159 [Cercospora zeina]
MAQPCRFAVIELRRFRPLVNAARHLVDAPQRHDIPLRHATFAIESGNRTAKGWKARRCRNVCNPGYRPTSSPSRLGPWRMNAALSRARPSIPRRSVSDGNLSPPITAATKRARRNTTINCATITYNLPTFTSSKSSSYNTIPDDLLTARVWTYQPFWQNGHLLIPDDLTL